MRILAIAIWLALILSVGRASASPELEAIQARYDRTHFPENEALRQKYVTELAQLRWRLVHNNKPGWEAVDAEIARHPMPGDYDGVSLKQMMVGVWLSPRHDYLFRSSGTWIMDPDPQVSDPTQGTWSISGFLYRDVCSATPDEPRTYRIVLLDARNFIFLDPKSGTVFYETRSLDKGLPLRRD